jgi:hypothetical protein
VADRLLNIFLSFASRARKRALIQSLESCVLSKITEALPEDLLLERPAA